MGDTRTNFVRLCFVSEPSKARLGDFIEVRYCDLKYYVRKFPIHWIEA